MALDSISLFFRAIFITSTILPPTRKLIGECSQSQTNGSMGSLALRTLHFVFTGGFKMNQGGNNICGGYLFSGHASIIILCSRFVCDYSSERIPSFVKYALRIFEVLCIVCIVIAREHYTIDVITAWFLMTREMWIYNSLLKLQDLQDSVAINQVWWAKFFVWIENDLPRDDSYLPKSSF
ncbi:unnamed protein product [Oikopleura dioica]|uniref:Sphingomyelin synthase-like domain-containing protein n=1 Tax=Oikopleura dioica TaxID=34765 RepID=E4Y4F8_OIKDI|nr:unnamed protein product [Oikopleura dioica]